MTSSVPPPSFGPNGFVTPDANLIIAGVKADVNRAFDNALNMSDDTPQGQLSVALSALAEYSNDTFLWFTNQVDPAYATGRMQDAIARINFIERKPAIPTTVIATVSGLTGTVLPAGSLAMATDGNIYSSLSAVTIPVSGSAQVTFQCNITGPIPCPAGTLNRVFRSVSGWDNVTNLVDGTVGTNTESRRAFEDRRAATVAKNALGTLPAIAGAVLDVSNVVDAYVTENDTGTAKTVGGVSLLPHSVYVAVAGGSDDDVARAIWSRKSGGAAYNGSTTVTVLDQSNGYTPPYPSYQVKFQRPTAVPIKFAVEIANSPDVPANAQDQIRDAIIATFTGADDGERERIGGTVFASRYYCPVAAIGSWVKIRSILVGRTTATATSVTVNINEIPSISEPDIVVTVT